MTTFIVIAVIVLVVLAVAFVVIRRKNREANIERAEELRTKAATEAQGTIAPAQERAATAEAEAAEARAIAEKAEAEAEAARREAQQVEASHEAQVRAADRLDPRVDHKADDYAPQVPGTTDQTPTPPSEVEAANTQQTTQQAEQPAEEPAAVEQPAADHPAAEAPAHEPAAEQPAAESAQDGTQDGRAPLLPRRTPGSNEMPGKPIEQTDGGGGWFTKDSDKS